MLHRTLSRASGNLQVNSLNFYSGWGAGANALEQLLEIFMNVQDQERLAEIRLRWMISSVQCDTASWESTFFLRLLDERNQEIQALKEQLQKKGLDFHQTA